ncbi:double-stranded RNA-binding protein 3-like isoform X2 [Ananas comosus]|nr:double-stranded RNA-binding protein 3-like isoform X2 [Ananas comosus]
MYKNQLQELAQRSCFSLPSYACVREGPDHAPRFKASVNFNGEVFVGPSNCTTLRQAEHAAAEVALSNLSVRAPSTSLAARVLDETGVYKNLLQETAHRAGLKLPLYTTVRSGPGHQPIFTSTVEIAGWTFTGDSAKTKKQAEKNAALAAWTALKQMPDLGSCSNQEKKESTECSEEQEHVVVERVLSNFKPKEEAKPMKPRSMSQHHKRREILNTSTSSTIATTTTTTTSSSYKHSWKPLEPSSEASSIHPTHPHPPNIRILAPPVLPPILPQSKDNKNNISPIPTPIPHSSLFEEANKDKGEKLVAKALPKFIRVLDQSASTFSHTSIKAPCLGDCKAIQVPGVISSGGYRAAGMAPAVNVRSVIPVCASPPMRTPVSNTNTTTTMAGKEGEERPQMPLPSSRVSSCDEEGRGLQTRSQFYVFE